MEQELAQINIQIKKNKSKFTQKNSRFGGIKQIIHCIWFNEMIPAETDEEPQPGTKEYKVKEYSQGPIPMAPRQTRSIAKTVSSNPPPTPGPSNPRKLPESGEPSALNETYEILHTLPEVSLRFCLDSAKEMLILSS